MTSQHLIGQIFCANYPLNSKTDNLLGLDLNVNKNIVICALIDTEAVGTL